MVKEEDRATRRKAERTRMKFILMGFEDEVGRDRIYF